jgi:hypothetical protein
MVATAKTRAKTGVDRALLLIEVLAGIGVVAAIIGKTYGVAPTIFFVLVGFAASFTGWALVRSVTAWRDATLDLTHHVRDEERERLEHEKMILLQGIKELEADLGIGKVDQRDYTHLRRTAENRAIAIIEKLKDQDARWMQRAEALVAERLGKTVAVARSGAPVLKINWVAADSEAARKEPADVRVFDDRPVSLDGQCGGCGAEALPAAKFCVQCGRPRA